MSLDVSDMFTNISVEKTVDIITNNNLGQYPYKSDLIKFLTVCEHQNYFMFNNKYYIQKEGLIIGCPLSPVMAEI